MRGFDDTVQFSFGKEQKNLANEIIMQVYAAMKEKGYDPISQMVGYILSGDPTYITSHNNARYLIRRLERDELLEEIVRFYIKENEELQ
ncbi:MAG: IreB family regulatory phosphoprotein [Christensenellales bacterium]